jgi:Mn2+/Fe2+ NRAMP family transporter
MFSTGQIVFALLFIIAFAIVMVFAYKKDLKLHNKNYKGVKWVGLFFILFLIILVGLKQLLKN